MFPAELSNGNSFPWDGGMGMECAIIKTFPPVIRMNTPGASIVTGIS